MLNKINNLNESITDLGPAPSSTQDDYDELDRDNPLLTGAEGQNFVNNALHECTPFDLIKDGLIDCDSSDTQIAEYYQEQWENDPDNPVELADDTFDYLVGLIDDMMEDYDLDEDDDDYEEDDTEDIQREPISVSDCIEICNGDEEAGTIIYNWLDNEDALYDPNALDYSNLLDLCDAATNNSERQIVGRALDPDGDLGLNTDYEDDDDDEPLEEGIDDLGPAVEDDFGDIDEDSLAAYEEYRTTRQEVENNHTGYAIYWYDGQPTADRRPYAYPFEGEHVDLSDCSDDDLSEEDELANAFIEAFYLVNDNGGADSELEDLLWDENTDDGEVGSNETIERLRDYFDNKDLGDGSPCLFAIKNLRTGEFVYGDEDIANNGYQEEFNMNAFNRRFPPLEFHN